jgi:CheY-like chemotaxis protein
LGLNVARGSRILVVEDDPAIRQTVAEVLADEGFDVACAVNGADALAHLAAATVPDLILLDLSMPVMDGWAFRSAQRSDPRLAQIPTVVVSASHGADARSLAALAPDAFLAKPFDLDRLLATIDEHCVATQPHPLATPLPTASAPRTSAGRR